MQTAGQPLMTVEEFIKENLSGFVTEYSRPIAQH